jgi:hypothetical protein
VRNFIDDVKKKFNYSSILDLHATDLSQKNAYKKFPKGLSQNNYHMPAFKNHTDILNQRGLVNLFAHF